MKPFHDRDNRSLRSIRNGVRVVLLIGWFLTALAAPFSAAEEGILLTPADGDMNSWRVTSDHDSTAAHSGIEQASPGVVRFRYDFTEGGTYATATCDLPHPATLENLSLRVRDPQQASLRIGVVDNANQTFQEPVFIGHTRWQRISLDMLAWDFHSGGPGDGVFRPPVKGFQIVVDNRDLPSPMGEIFLADVTAEPEPQGKSDGVYEVTYRVTDFGNDSGFQPGAHSTLRDRVWRVDLSQARSAALTHSLPLFGSARRGTLTVRGGNPGNILKIQLGSHFQVFRYTLGALDGKEKTFRFPFPIGGPDERTAQGDDAQAWEYWGGESDGIVRLPLRVVDVLLERGEGPASPGELELVDLRCETLVPRDEAVLARSQLIQTASDGETRRVAASCTAWNLLDKPLTGTLTFTVQDWQETVLQRNESEWTIPAEGVPATTTLTASIPAKLNFAEATFQFEAGETRLSSRACLTQGPHDAGDPDLRPESPWGMGVYLYRYPGNAEGLAQMDRAAALAQAAGVKWSREEFGWARIEPSQGQFDFSFYDDLVETAHRHGISVYGLLSYWSDWTQPYTEAGIEDYCHWARATVRHFKDRIKHWEIYNEPNIFFWSGPKDLYYVLLKKAYAAIKAEDPQAQVLGMSTSGIDRRFIEKGLETAAPFDVLTVHPYRRTLIEEGLTSELQRIARLADDRPVWITEMGWSTQVGGVDERTQAELLARSYLASIGSGACQNVSWYDFRCDGADPFYNEANFGVLRTDLVPKPAYRALMTVCRTLAGGIPRPVHFPDRDVHVLEADAGMAFWSTVQPLKVDCKIQEGHPSVVNLMGEPVSSSRDGETIPLTLTPGRPLFVTGAKLVPCAEPVPLGPPEELGVLSF